MPATLGLAPFPAAGAPPTAAAVRHASATASASRLQLLASLDRTVLSLMATSLGSGTSSAVVSAHISGGHRPCRTSGGHRSGRRPVLAGDDLRELLGGALGGQLVEHDLAAAQQVDAVGDLEHVDVVVGDQD